MMPSKGGPTSFRLFPTYMSRSFLLIALYTNHPMIYCSSLTNNYTRQIVMSSLLNFLSLGGCTHTNVQSRVSLINLNQFNSGRAQEAPLPLAAGRSPLANVLPPQRTGRIVCLSLHCRLSSIQSQQAAEITVSWRTIDGPATVGRC